MVQDLQKQRIVTGLSMAANSTLKAQFNGITLLVTTPSSIGNTNMWFEKEAWGIFNKS
jgi:hypothetical protein